MAAFLIRRLIYAMFVLVGLVIIVFFVTNLLGDPARLMLRPEATEEQADALRERLGLNDPLLERFGRYMANAAQGDFGESIWQRVPAFDVALDRLPNTLYLTSVTFLIAIPIAVIIGVVSALKPGSSIDRIATVIALGGISTADFWLGLMLILLFSVELGWLPTSGFGGPEYVVLPALALAARPIGRLSQVLRDSLVQQMRQGYVTTARSKGLRERVVVTGHALKNAAIPAITLGGDEVAALLSGAVVIETVFGWPGIGFLLIQAIERRDLPLIVSCVVLLSSVILLINLLVDVAYTLIDPRVRLK